MTEKLAAIIAEEIRDILGRAAARAACGNRAAPD